MFHVPPAIVAKTTEVTVKTMRANVSACGTPTVPVYLKMPSGDPSIFPVLGAALEPGAYAGINVQQQGTGPAINQATLVGDLSALGEPSFAVYVNDDARYVVTLNPAPDCEATAIYLLGTGFVTKP